jgi:AcrR family transcriptional regulator
VPKLWTETVDEHRQAVRDAIVHAAGALVAEHGLRSVTMSQIARKAGIGRATLYKYFPDVEAILVVWHQQQIAHHLQELNDARSRGGAVVERLEAVLETYALLSRGARGHHDNELAAFLHRDPQVTAAQQQVRDIVSGLLSEGTATGEIRDDVAAEELAHYCLHALSAAASLPSKAAVARLVSVTLSGLRRPLAG